MEVVDPEVTRRKVDRELSLWTDNETAYRRRGWILLRHQEVEVDVAFVARLPLGPQRISVIAACIRIDFTNFDLWAPGVEFIDPFTGEYAPPVVQALVDSDEGPRDLLVQSHPETNRPFFCVPGIRQYHEHPQHSGDSWLLHRRAGEGSLATICDRVWRSMARSLLGIHVELQTLPGQLQLQLRIVNAPGEVAPAMWEQAEQAQQAARAAQAGLVVPPGVDPAPNVLQALGLAPIAPQGGR